MDEELALARRQAEAALEAQAQAEAQAEAVKAQEAIEANAFAAAEACLLGFAPLAPLEPVDAQPPKLKPALKREPIPLRKLKTATLTQVLACSQYWQKDAAKAHAFYQRWKEESKAHREVVRLALEEKNRKDKAFAEAKAAREAKQAAAAAARAKKEAEAREARGWNQLMSQGAKKEKAEERLARGMGTSYVVPTEETNDKATGTLAKIRISQVLPTIKIPAAAMLKGRAPPKPEEAAEVEVGEVKAVRIKLAGSGRPLQRALPAKRKAPEVEEVAAGTDPYARRFKPRRRAARSFEAASASDAGGAVPEDIALPEARSSSAASDAESEVRVRVGVRLRVLVELTRAQVSRARGRTQAGPWQRCPFPCHTPCVPNAAVPSVALTRTTPIRTWRRQSRLARLRRPARAALRPRPSPPPAHSDDHARRTPAAVAPPALARAVAPAGAVAPRVVAGGDGPSGTQVSEHSAAFMEGEGGGRTTRLHLQKRPSCSILISVRRVFAQTTGPERDCVLRVS